ncbi:MAG: AAA family ATPase, partial [Thermoplasmata archaeon]
VPATGKTTICRHLTELGMNCVEGNDIAQKSGCLKNGEVDIECMKDYLRSVDFHGIISSHYSHLLGCRRVIIIYADENKLRERMEKRHYSEEKIQENIDSQNADVIYYEALDLMPENRIFRINNEGMDETLKNVINLIEL